MPSIKALITAAVKLDGCGYELGAVQGHGDMELTVDELQAVDMNLSLESFQPEFIALCVHADDPNGELSGEDFDKAMARHARALRKQWVEAHKAEQWDWDPAHVEFGHGVLSKENWVEELEGLDEASDEDKADFRNHVAPLLGWKAARTRGKAKAWTWKDLRAADGVEWTDIVQGDEGAIYKVRLASNPGRWGDGDYHLEREFSTVSAALNAYNG